MKILQLVMVYLQAKQTGQSPLAALAMALLNSGSPLTNKDYRAQSGALVMQSLQSGMAMVGVDAPFQNIVVGVVLVIAVLVDILYRKRTGEL